MALIDITDLTFAYDGSYDTIFEHVSFQIDTNWKLGFTGRNGRGKTTFLKLLLGEYEYQGVISSPVEFDYFPFEISDPTQSAYEIAEQLNPDLEFWQLNRELTKLQLDESLLYQPFYLLSNGEQTKIMLAILFLKENHFLLIDEPTNHLDEQARETVGKYLNQQTGFILVSHDRAFLDSCIDHILSINRNNIEIQKGNFSSWYHNKSLQDQFERSENEKLKKDIKRLTASSRRTAGWSDQVEKTKYNHKNAGLRPDRGAIGHKSAKMMKRAKAIESRKNTAIEEKSKLLKNLEKADQLRLQPLSYHKKTIVTLDSLSVCYHEKNIFNPLSFSVQQGERIALQGKNGSGKSSILKLIAGYDIPHQGTIQTASGLIISYVPQDTSNLSGTLTEYATEFNLEESFFKSLLRKLDFPRTQLEKRMEDFSAGQKKKVLIARSLCEQAHLYLWDEPLNYIDVLSRMQIEQLLLECSATLLFVEHDRTFTEKIATRTILLSSDV